MNLKALCASALFAVGLAGGGAAVAVDSYVFTATFEQPVAQKEISAADLVWTCAEKTCVARGFDRINANDCRALASKAGKVASYGTGKTTLKEDKLAYCNAKAAGTEKSETADAKN